jgi:uncharacterized membrane protein
MMSGPVRHAYLDRVRGLAVLIMVEAHVLDSWTRVSDRTHPGFGYAMVLGGLGAPLFLFLAGVAAVLSAESKLRKTGDFGAAWMAPQIRGWQVFGLAFLFRLQSYILSGGFSAASLLKVDILNIMGPAIAFTAIVGRTVKRQGARAALFAACAVAIAMLTPIVRITPLLDWLPDPVEWYFRPSPGRTNFTLFPWAGFVFAGAVAGVVIGGATSAGSVLRVQVGLAAAAVLVAFVAYRASFLPSIYAKSEFWTSSPTFFFLRVGLLTLLLPLAFLWDRGPWRGRISHWSPLETLGRASLFVYWVHVEMVYGFFSRPLRRALGFEEVLVAYALFTAFLLALVLLKNRLTESRKHPPHPAMAMPRPLSN